jgi:CBS domain containing-hemolysin-like protein
LLVAAGFLAAIVGVTVAVSVTTHNKRELARLVSQRLRGFTTASRILSSQERTVESANIMATVGVLVGGFGLAAAFRGLPPLLSAATGFLLAVPVGVSIIFAFPRTVGRRWPGVFAGGPARWVNAIAGGVVRLLKRADSDREELLVETLKLGGEEELYEPKELAIISGVLSFDRLPVRNIMTPRTEVVAVEEGMPIRELARVFNESGFSRLPVYRKSLDDVTGMVYAFDLLKVPPGGDLPLRAIGAVPESKPCPDLLLEMQRDRRHMAMVLDEFGGVAGAVTMENLLQELVRQLFGEFREEPRKAVRAETVEFGAAEPLETLSERYGVKLGDAAETIGSLLVKAVGRIPSVGERFNIEGLEVEIVDATPARVERVSVRRGPVAVQDISLDEVRS